MTKFINRLDNNTIAYNQLTGKKEGIVFLSGFNSDMQGKKALYLEKWAEENNHSFLRFDYSGHGQSSGSIDKTCCEYPVPLKLGFLNPWTKASAKADAIKLLRTKKPKIIVKINFLNIRIWVFIEITKCRSVRYCYMDLPY